MAGESVANITFIRPSVISTAAPCRVEVHVNVNADGDQKMDLVRRENGQEWIMKEVKNKSEIIKMDIDSEGHGPIDFFIQSKEGTALSPTVCVVSAPPSVTKDLNRVFQSSIMGLMDAARFECFDDTSLSIEELEESPLLAMKTTWQRHFRHLVADLGELLEYMSSCRDTGRLAPKCLTRDHFMVKLTDVLKFLTANSAYDAGNFLLLSAAASGETITLDGTPLEIDQLDLRKLQQEC